MVFQKRLKISQKIFLNRLPTILRTLISFLATGYSKDAWGLLFKIEYTRLCTRLFFSMDTCVETASNSLSLHARH